MGYAIVLWVYEDGISEAEGSPVAWARLRPQVGEATLQVCIGGPRGVKSHPVRGHGNCVNYCDEVHSSDARLYLWHGNRLCPLHRADHEDFAVVERLVAEEKARRNEPDLPEGEQR